MSECRPGAEDLRAAIADGDAAAVRDILASDPDICNADIGEAGPERPLHRAAWLGRVEIARLLIETGAHLDALNHERRFPLHNAIEAGEFDLVELLVDSGAIIDVNAAAILGRLDRLRELLAKDPDLARDDSTGIAALDWAAFGNRVDSGQILLEHGADISLPGPLFSAVSVNGVEFVRFLLDGGADVGALEKGDWTLLHEGARMRYTRDSSAVVALLLERGADPHARDARGRTPLDVARQLRAHPEPAAAGEPPHRHDRVEALLAAATRPAGTGD